MSIDNSNPDGEKPLTLDQEKWWREAMNANIKPVVILSRLHNVDISGYVTTTGLENYKPLILDDGVAFTSASHPIPPWHKRVWFWMKCLRNGLLPGLYPKLSEESIEDIEIEIKPQSKRLRIMRKD